MSLEVPAPVAVRMSTIPLYEGDHISTLDLVPVLYRTPTGSYKNKLALRTQILGFIPDQNLATTSQVEFARVDVNEFKANSTEIEAAFIKELRVGEYLTPVTSKQVEYILHAGSSSEQIYTFTHYLATEDVQVQVFIKSATGDYYSLIITSIDVYKEGDEHKVRIHIKNINTTEYKVVIVG